MPQNYLQLITEANAVFQKSYPGAFVFTALGMPNSGTLAKTADDLSAWIYLATDGKLFAQLDYANGAFGTPSQSAGRVGLEYVALPQGTIRLPQAIDILNQNGYTEGFSSVSLGTPVYYQAQPMFWFCVDGQTQGVSASTGEVFRNLFPCQAGELSVPPQ